MRADGWLGDPDQLAQIPAAKNPAALTPDLRRRLDTYIEESVARLRASTFHPTLAEPKDAGCEYCDHRHACKVNHLRNAGIRAGLGPAAPYQAPLEEEVE